MKNKVLLLFFLLIFAVFVAAVAPSIDSVTITSGTNKTNETLQGFCEFSDADSDNLTVNGTWYKNDVSFSSSSTSFVAGVEFNYTGTSFDVSATNGQGLGMAKNGSFWYVVDATNDDVNVFTESWVFSTSHNISGQVTSPRGIDYDGTNWWIVDAGTNKVYKYFANFTYTGTEIDFTTEAVSANDINYNGSHWFLLGISEVVYVYNSTFGYTGTNYSIAAQGSSMNGIYWDTLNWYAVDTSTDKVFKYNSTFDYQNKNFSISTESTNPHAIHEDGNFWYIYDATSDTVFKYTTTNISQNANILNVASGSTSKGQNWTFQCDVDDGTTVVSQNSTQVTIINSEPVVSVLNITQTNPEPTENLNFTNTTTDADTDTITAYNILWYKDGVVQSSLENQTTVGSGNTSFGEVWIVSLRATDGTSFGSFTNSSSITINDTVNPTLSGDSLSASSGFDDSAFTASINISDASSISSVSVEVTDPNTVASNLSMSTTDNLTWTRSVTPSTDGVYTFKFYATDVNSNLGNLTSALTYTEDTSVPAGGGGGGGGGSSSIKEDCLITFDPESIIFSRDNQVQQLQLINDEDQTITPSYLLSDSLQGLILVSVQDTDIQPNSVGRVNLGFQSSGNVTGNGTLTFSSVQCNDIEIPVTINEVVNVQEVFAVTSFKEFVSFMKDYSTSAVFSLGILQIFGWMILVLGYTLGFFISRLSENAGIAGKTFITLFIGTTIVFVLNFILNLL